MPVSFIGNVIITPSTRVCFLLKVGDTFPDLIQAGELKCEVTDFRKVNPFLNQWIWDGLDTEATFSVIAHEIRMYSGIGYFTPDFTHRL